MTCSSWIAAIRHTRFCRRSCMRVSTSSFVSPPLALSLSSTISVRAMAMTTSSTCTRRRGRRWSGLASPFEPFDSGTPTGPSPSSSRPCGARVSAARDSVSFTTCGGRRRSSTSSSRGPTGGPPRARARARSMARAPPGVVARAGGSVRDAMGRGHLSPAGLSSLHLLPVLRPHACRRTLDWLTDPWTAMRSRKAAGSQRSSRAECNRRGPRGVLRVEVGVVGSPVVCSEPGRMRIGCST